jgi:putative alpha-1,2-mannosidase
VIGRPFVERATLNLPNGKRFTVRAVNLSAANGYVGSVTLNGKPLARSFLRHEDILAGGELVFTMQAAPNTGLGQGQERPSLHADGLLLRMSDELRRRAPA